MYCPSCGKQVPDGSSFCLHCGSSMTSPAVGTKEEWEYKDFVLKWNHGDGGRYFLKDENHDRRLAWNAHQSQMLTEIQEWHDVGWKPVSEVGPAAFSFRPNSGLLDMLFMQSVFELAEFRVKMRRLKSGNK